MRVDDGSNYCTSGPTAQVSWVYFAPDGLPQSGYQVQIATDSGFSGIAIDTCPGGPPSGTCAPGTSSTIYAIQPGALSFNTTYYARVRSWNTGGLESGWVNMSQCSGPYCGAGNTSWSTPPYQYPDVAFVYVPPRPARNATIQFTDQTNFGDPPPGVGRSWFWNFGDGTTSTAQNPAKVYATYGDFIVTLTSTDSAGQSCTIDPPVTISVQKPIPLWREILPR